MSSCCAAPTLWAKSRAVVLRTTRGLGMWARLRLRFNVDTNLRAHFTKSGHQGDGGPKYAASAWPLCLDVGSHGMLEMDHSLGSTQNHSRGGW